MKTQEDYLATKNLAKERLEDYSTSQATVVQ